MSKEEEGKDQLQQGGEEGKQPKTPPAEDGKKQEEEEKKYTDSEVNALLNQKFAELSAKLEKKYAISSNRRKTSSPKPRSSKR